MKLLRSGGRLGFISSNSFFKAGYAEPLRRFLPTVGRVEQLIDLGDTQVFSAAKDVYPAIAVLSKDFKSKEKPLRTLRLRRQDRPENINEYVEKWAIEVPLSRLDSSGWQFDNPAVGDVRNKMMNAGTPLGSMLNNGIFRGLLTGLNEAFVVATHVKDRLLSHPKASEIVKPFVGGQHIRRWFAEDSGNWVIAIPSGSTASRSGTSNPEEARNWLRKTYPTVEAHLGAFEAPARKRTDQGQFWWELRACDYYPLFDQPKIIYPDIAKSPRFFLDKKGLYSNNTTYFLPVADYYLLGVLNSPALWFMLSGISIPFGERAGEFRYRLFTQYMEKLPIPVPTDETREAIETGVRRLIEFAAEQESGLRAMLDWLRVEFGIDKPSQRLQVVAHLDADALTGEVKKARGRSKPLSVAQVRRLKEEHVGTVVPLQTLAGEALTLEGRVSDLVNAAYGLTAEEVALMWQTAPPRMPLPPPDKAH